MRLTQLALSEIEERQLAHWRRLAELAVEPNPFFEPELVLPAAVALEAAPALLVATDASGEWIGAVPIVRERGWHHLPLQAFAAWRHPYSFFGAPLIREGAEQEVFRGWLSDEQPALSPILGLDLLDARGRVHAALKAAADEAGARTVVVEEHARPAVRRGEKGLSLRRSSKHRREVRRLLRRLSEHLGGEVELIDRSDDPEAVEAFLRLEASGWKGRRRTALASDPTHAEFFRELCAGFRRLDRLQLLSLETDGAVAAMCCNLSAGDTLFCFKIAFDESLEKFSPGMQLQHALIKLENENERIDCIDSCIDADNEMGDRIWPQRRQIASLAIVGGGLGSAPSRLLVRGAARTREILKPAP
jgi:CelD/BcsL family acetyltransferase involved in cellulose biosynthesis